jgi:hypothetical protein
MALQIDGGALGERREVQRPDTKAVSTKRRRLVWVLEKNRAKRGAGDRGKPSPFQMAAEKHRNEPLPLFLG